MDAEERHVFLRAAAAFRQYAHVFDADFIAPRLALAEHADLPHHIVHLRTLGRLAASNAEIVASFADSLQLFVDDDGADRYGADEASEVVEPSQLDESKVASTLRQLAREWSCDGADERRQSFGRIEDALCRYFDARVRPDTRVMVPGSGLGRLPFDLSRAGFDAIGNEFSTHMLLASHTMLNTAPSKDAWTIYPYIHSPSHWRTTADQYREASIPDVWPAGCEQLGSMSMAIGGFEELAMSEKSAGTLHAIATCFFIDAPYNFIDTLRAITNIVELGGLWVNFGPLHWHSEAAVGGLEFSLEDVIKLIENAGWEFLERESRLPATYCSTHPNRMARMVFECEFWVARKISLGVPKPSLS